MDVLHRVFGYIAPQRLTSILRDRKLEKDLRVSDSDLRRYVDHVLDECVRSKSKMMKSLLAQYAIKQVFTSYNTPEQNALMERVWRTLGEMATCMLLEAELPETFWEEA